MATIKDLAVSISEMSSDEAFKLIEKIQNSRLLLKITKFDKKTAKTRTKTKKEKVNPLENIDKMELLKLLKESLNG